MRFGLGPNGSEHTLEEVGQRFAVTRERIRQIEAKALRQAPPSVKVAEAEGVPGERKAKRGNAGSDQKASHRLMAGLLLAHPFRHRSVFTEPGEMGEMGLRAHVSPVF